MNRTRIQEILDLTTKPYRKGEVIDREAGERFINLYDIDHIDKITSEEEKVDLFSIFIGVKKEKAKEFVDELKTLISEFPNRKELKCGLGYKQLGKEIGVQAAMQCFAFGKVIGWWELIGPRELVEGINDRSAKEMFYGGTFYMTGLE